MNVIAINADLKFIIKSDTQPFATTVDYQEN